MMKIVGINNNNVVTIFNWAETIDDITELPEGFTAEYAPDNVTVGWIFENGVYIPPVQSGFQYDEVDNKYYSHNQYRAILHERTTNDTLQAMRKIREGDMSYDWQGWLDKLDAYNLAIEETKNQPTYPKEVEYPTYPKK